MSETDPTPQSLLGSTLLSIAKSHAEYCPRPASCGCVGIDELVLGGGFRYGQITSIAGENGTVKTTVRGYCEIKLKYV